MRFPVFLFLIWGMGLYYRSQHLSYIKELSLLAPRLEETGADALRGLDWRLVRKEDNTFVLKRAFEVRGADGRVSKSALLRYCPPFAAFLVILFLLQDWKFAAGYAAIVAACWFYAETVVKTGIARSYEVRLFGVRLFGEPL